MAVSAYTVPIWQCIENACLPFLMESFDFLLSPRQLTMVAAMQYHWYYQTICLYHLNNGKDLLLGQSPKWTQGAIP